MHCHCGTNNRAPRWTAKVLLSVVSLTSKFSKSGLLMDNTSSMYLYVKLNWDARFAFACPLMLFWKFHIVSYWPKYCKRGNFRVGVIFAFFAILPSSRKFSPRENKPHMTLLRKYEKYRENYPYVKCLDSIFAKFSPSENNHVYSSCGSLNFMYKIIKWFKTFWVVYNCRNIERRSQNSIQHAILFYSIPAAIPCVRQCRKT